MNEKKKYGIFEEGNNKMKWIHSANNNNKESKTFYFSAESGKIINYVAFVLRHKSIYKKNEAIA